MTSLVAFAATVSGCALGAPTVARRDVCEMGFGALCSTVGAERRCECVPRTELDRFLTTLGEPAWVGGPH